MRLILAALLLAATACPAASAQTHPAAAADPVADAARPAGMAAFVLPVQGGAVNAVLYTASGSGPHPTLLLLHGFPGNEQNLDLAQAARRGGWNVLTLHYRGSWGSPGAFSFAGAASDAHSALAFLFDRANLARYGIDPTRIVVAGHSMGGFMAADAAADDSRVAGLVLIDAWDIAETARDLATAKGRADWAEEAAGDLPPLAGTSADLLAREMIAGGARFDLGGRVRAYGKRPLLIAGAERGAGASAEQALEQSTRSVGNDRVTGVVMPTDHPFSDHRIALASLLLGWLDRIAPAR